MRIANRLTIFFVLIVVFVFFSLVSTDPITASNPTIHQINTKLTTDKLSTVKAGTEGLKVVSVKKLDLLTGPQNRAAYLSPDGTRFAYFDNATFCFYTIAGEKQACSEEVKAHNIRVDTESVRWLPDGTQLVFAEKFLGQARDLDIWLLDAKSGQFTNRTGKHDSEPSAATEAVDVYKIDVAPQFLPNSKTLYFLHYPFSKSGDLGATQVQLFKATVGNAASLKTPPTLATKLALDPKSATAFVLSPNGSKIAYSDNGHGSVAKESGAWIANADGTNATLMLPFSEADKMPLPTNYTFSADGKYVIDIAREQLSPSEPKAGTSPVRVIPVAGGEALPIDTQTYVLNAGWSPQGSAILYVTYPNFRAKTVAGLYIEDELGKPGRLLLEGRYLATTPLAANSLFWASNNTILLVSAEDQKLVVVTLGK